MERFIAVRRMPTLLAAGTLLAANAFLAAPAQAQVPAAASAQVKWEEGFDNPAAALPVALTGYTGLHGELYTAAADWLPPASGGASRCNGWVLGAGATSPAADAQCGANGGRYVINTGTGGTSTLTAWGFLRRMAVVMGTAQGIAGNNAVASLSNGTGATQNQTTTLQLSIADIGSYPGAFTPEPGHFYVASAMFAAIHCNADAPYSGATPTWNDPQENIHLVANGARVGALQTASNICPAGLTQTTPPRAYVPPALPNVVPAPGYYPYPDSPNNTGAGNVFVATLYSEPYLFQLGDSLGLEINNSQLSGLANDVAFDKLQIWDVTPALYKSFDAADPDNSLHGAIVTGGTGQLTFVIVNTAEGFAKNGLSFTDFLPNGVTIASPAGMTNTCGGTVAAAPGGTQIELTGGSLAAGAAECRISVNVTAAAAGVYENDVGLATGARGTVTKNGLVPAQGPARLTVTNPPPGPVAGAGATPVPTLDARSLALLTLLMLGALAWRMRRARG